MKKKYTIILIISLLIVLSIISYPVFKGNNLKVAFVKNTELYNDFGLKKELEAKLMKVKNQRKSILDSLLLDLKMVSARLENVQLRDEKEIQKFQIQKQLYLTKQKEFDEDTERLAEQYNEQIWKQINQYTNDFGKKEGYSFVYGAKGDGALMYAQDQYDITKELTEYINEKYKGETK